MILSSKLCHGKSVDCLPVRSWNKMPVDVYSDFDRRVPHLLSHVSQRFTILDEQRRERMAKVMQSNLSQLGFFEASVQRPCCGDCLCLASLLPDCRKPTQESLLGSHPQRSDCFRRAIPQPSGRQSRRSEDAHCHPSAP
jgi:hypothetical protein